MAKVSNAFGTYQAKANREVLADTIHNLDPFDTPLTMLAGRKTVPGRQWDWQKESLPTPPTTALVEGFEYSRQAATPTTRLSNVTQINSINATVTGSQEASDAAGKSKGELAHQMAISAKALKIAVDEILGGTQARSNGDDSTARQTRALEHWIQTNVSFGAGGASAASETAALTDGTQRSFTEELLADSMQQAYTLSRVIPDHLVVGPYCKTKVSKFQGRNGSQIIVNKNTIVGGGVTVYESDFGDLKVMPSNNIRPRTAFLISPEMLKVAYFRNYFTKDMETMADADGKIITVEWGLEVGNEKAHAKIADLIDTRAGDE